MITIESFKKIRGIEELLEVRLQTQTSAALQG